MKYLCKSTLDQGAEGTRSNFYNKQFSREGLFLKRGINPQPVGPGNMLLTASATGTLLLSLEQARVHTLDVTELGSKI